MKALREKRRDVLTELQRLGLDISSEEVSTAVTCMALSFDNRESSQKNDALLEAVDGADVCMATELLALKADPYQHNKVYRFFGGLKC